MNDEKHKHCICGDPEGLNIECERCRFIATIESDKELLGISLKEIIALRSELGNCLGTPVVCSAVAMMIEDRLGGLSSTSVMVDHLKDRITEITCNLLEAKTKIRTQAAGANSEIMFLKNTVRSVVQMADKMSRSGSADRCRAGNDIMNLINETAIKGG